MKTIKLGIQHNQVRVLQKLLNKAGFAIAETGTFDTATDTAVRAFQQQNGLGSDGVAGNDTWSALLKKHYKFSLGATNYFLNADEWMNDLFIKDTIYIHHTAGRHRPDFTIDWWEKDNKPGKLNRVATAFVIGGNALDGSADFDGQIYRAFNEIYWAHHLGTTLPNNETLNKKSIGIEVCCLGPVVSEGGKFWFKTASGKFEVPQNQVIELNQAWRGFKFFHKYSETQLEVLKNLILTLAFLFDIPLPDKQYTADWFKLDNEAKAGKAGLWTHCHVRSDKTDCYPHPQLIEMLNSLHQASLTFTFDDSLEMLESIMVLEKNDLDNPEIENYTADLADVKPHGNKRRKRIN
jgi:N-acetyl-anhydromuramyl-L-alanine amidase AmpD